MKPIVLFLILAMGHCFSLFAAQPLSLNPRAGQDTSACEGDHDINPNKSADELRSEIEQLQARLEERQKELARVTEIQIDDCDSITVHTDEDREILEELKYFCRQNPNSFFAQLDVSGDLKFLLKFSQKDNQVFTFSTTNDVTFKYKSHSLILKGSYDIDIAGKEGEEGFARNQNIKGSGEYGIDIGESNFEAFAKIAHESSMTAGNDGDNNIHTTTGTVGVKYHFLETDRTKLYTSLGAGVTYKQFGGSLATQENSLVPVVSAEMGISHILMEDRLKGNATVGYLQDLSGDRNSAVTWSAGIDARIWGGLSMGTSYMGSYDETRGSTGSEPFNHTILGTVGFSLDPSSWKSKEKREKEERARARVQQWRERERQPASE